MSFARSLVTRARTLPWTHRRCFRTVPANTRHNLFEYTSGRWIVNNDLRIAERKRVFNADGLRQLAAQSVNRRPEDIVDVEKDNETSLNRSFLITMRDGFKMVAHIPYGITPAKYLSVASEAATMAFLHASGLPVPRVYGYSPVTDNAAGTEYILMEHVSGTFLHRLWDRAALGDSSSLDEPDIVSLTQQIVKLETQMMAISFPAAGCLYYTKDLEEIGAPGIALEQDARFSVGPDSRPHMWSGRRAELLNVDRGPYKTAEALLIGGTEKELAFLGQFGRPRFPLNRVHRAAYGDRDTKQQPVDHIVNLIRYKLILPALVPKDPARSRFAIRHQNLDAFNIIVSRSPTDSRLNIISLIDWQHNPVLPFFLLSNPPKYFDAWFDASFDEVSYAMIPPMFPENLDDMSEGDAQWEKERYKRSLWHYHYVKHMEEHNPAQYAGFYAPLAMFREQIVEFGSTERNGDSLSLKRQLLAVSEDLWEELSEEDGMLCPITFDPEAAEMTKLYMQVRETMEQSQIQMDRSLTLERVELVRKLRPEDITSLTGDLRELGLEISRWFLEDYEEDE
ncbi:protein kinase subdomain-containing protein PKL/CAK/Fmp29 [Roridomyces roridus]|uniref:Protein kinase subdomain-containing protein PKL/CAK/Fmp29 n=1 Tax=Roridomyces roridus TaxID=1738132 RepID=A0AAD7FE40_9AGAR|nr:protein kinase subdomain-containing protein PKL/CAK/Fmp29 [Roridomyces roridus]